MYGMNDFMYGGANAFGDGLNTTSMQLGQEPNYMGGLGSVAGMGQVPGMESATGPMDFGGGAGAGGGPMAAMMGMKALSQLGSTSGKGGPSAPPHGGVAPRGNQVQMKETKSEDIDPRVMASIMAMMGSK